MVEPTPDLIQQESAARMEALRLSQNPERPAFLDDPILDVTKLPDLPEAEQPVPQTIEAISLPRPSDTDPEIVQDAYNDNPFIAGASAAIYGVGQVEQAVRAWQDGTDTPEMQPLPAVQLIQEATGEPLEVVGDFLYRKSRKDETLSDLRAVIGPVRMGALTDAFAKYGSATDLDFDPRSWYAKFGSDLATLVVDDVADVAVASGVGAFTSVNRTFGNMAKALSPLIPSIGTLKIGVQDQAQFEYLSQAGVNMDGVNIGDVVEAPKGFDMQAYTTFMNDGVNPLDAEMDALQALRDEAFGYIDSGTGKVLADIGEFGIAYMATPTFLKGSKALATIANGALKSTVASNFIYEEGDETLVAYLRDIGVPVGPLGNLLDTDEDDSAVIARLKFVAEDVALGVGIESLARGAILGFRALKRGDVEDGAKKFGDGLGDATKKVSAETKAWYDDLRARVEAGQTDTRRLTAEELAPPAPVAQGTLQEAAATTARSVDTKPIEFTQVTVETSDAWTKYAKTGRFYDVDIDNPDSAQILTDITGRKDFVEVLKDPSNLTFDIYNALFQRLRAAAGRIQAPKDQAVRAAETQKVLDEVGMDVLDPELRDAIDPSKWSDSGEANLRAAVTIQMALREEIMRLDYLISELSMDDLAKAKQLATEKAILQSRVAELQLGIQKIAANSGRTLRAFGRINEIDNAALKEQQLELWRRKQGIVGQSPILDARKRVTAYEAAKDTAKATGKNPTAAAAKVAGEATKEGFLDQVRRVTSGWLLGNPKTLSTIFLSNFVRVVVGPVLEKVTQGALVEPTTALLKLLGGKPKEAADALKRSAQSVQSALLYWPTMARFLPRGVDAWRRYWKTGMSDFLQTADLDEAGEIGKSLSEMGFRGGAMTVYRLMGAMDESFKELMVSTEQAIRAKQGAYGPALKRKNVWEITAKDVSDALEGDGARNPFAVEGTGGRLSEGFVIDDTRRALFQQDPVEGSIKAWTEKQLHNQSRSAAAIRLFFLRFTTAPLSIMEFGFMNVFAPVVLVSDLLPPSARQRVLNGWTVLMGRYADDLNSEFIEVKQRARSILALASMFQGIGLYLGVTGEAEKYLETDASSPNYLQIKRQTEGGTRYHNIEDLEGNINPILMWAGFGDLVRQGLIDPVEAVEAGEALSLSMALMLNGQLEKGSLGPLRDALDMFDPDGATAGKAIQQFAISTLSTFNPYNYYQKKVYDWAGNVGADQPRGFDGKATDWWERLGKSMPVLKPIAGAVINKRRNALGELIPPATGMTIIGAPLQPYNPVLGELEDIKARSGYDFARERFSQSGIEYHLEKWDDGQSIYDRAQKLIFDGSVRINGKTLYEALEAKIDSSVYQRALAVQEGSLTGRPYTDEGEKRAADPSNKDVRIGLLRETFDDFRLKAVATAFNELPEDKREEIEERRRQVGITPEEVQMYDPSNF